MPRGTGGWKKIKMKPTKTVNSHATTSKRDGAVDSGRFSPRRMRSCTNGTPGARGVSASMELQCSDQ
jgi:hypothetical protein